MYFYYLNDGKLLMLFPAVPPATVSSDQTHQCRDFLL